MLTRREFVRLAALAGAGTSLAGIGCASGGERSPGTQKPGTGPGGGERTLRIALWSHFIPAYEQWFDNEYTKRWGEDHDIDVIVDHMPLTELPSRAAAEVASGQGHDLFAFTAPPPAFEDAVVEHGPLVAEVEARVGPMAPLCERSTRNPKTGKYFGFPHFWVANAAHYRADLWEQVAPGLRPDTWESVFRAGPRLKAMGNPIGIGMSDEVDYDSTYSLMTLMHAFGASVQDESGRLVVNSPATLEAVRFGTSLFRTGMTEEVLSWDASSNNRSLASGKASMILNAISAIRTAEEQDPALAASIRLARPPAGPAGGAQSIYVTLVFVIWKFARNQEAARRFLVDLALNSRELFLRSRFYNLPAFPGAVPDMAELVASDVLATPTDKYAFLAGAPEWSTNIGHPGHANGAVDEVFNQFLVPRMFATAATGQATPEEAVARGEAWMKPIFDSWRERGKI